MRPPHAVSATEIVWEVVERRVLRSTERAARDSGGKAEVLMVLVVVVVVVYVRCLEAAV